jgi:pimeloyl-ACP methyl ester carboxylesterase
MKDAHSKLASKVGITEVHLTGYSLGGTQSAFLMAIDNREQAFRFKKVLMINPSVDLFASVQILDGLFDYALPGGNESVIGLVERLLAEVSSYAQEKGRNSVDSELLYKIAEKRISEGNTPTQIGLASLIAAAFRISASNMFFSVDVLADGGHIVDKGTELKVGTPLAPYFGRSMTWSFERYVDEVLLPFWQSRRSGLDREALIEQSSLRSLERMLSADTRIAVVTNANDFILTAKNLEFLRTTLGDRVKIYPSGGHLGNLNYRDNADYMVRYFTGGAP